MSSLSPKSASVMRFAWPHARNFVTAQWPLLLWFGATIVSYRDHGGCDPADSRLPDGRSVAAARFSVAIDCRGRTDGSLVGSGHPAARGVRGRRPVRISTPRHADVILVMEQGQCLGIGSHDMLVQECPLYRDLWGHSR